MVKIRKATMKDLNDIVKIESDAFHMSKEMTEKDMIGRIKNYPDTFLVAEEEGKVVAHVFGPAFEKRYIEDKLYFENHQSRRGCIPNYFELSSSTRMSKKGNRY